MVSAAGFGLLAGFLLVWRRRQAPVGPLTAACLITALWCLGQPALVNDGAPSLVPMVLLDMLRAGAWLWFGEWQSQPDDSVNGQRLWDSLMAMAEIGATPAGGSNRQALTDEDRAGRDLFIRWCEQAGCRIRIDEMGNIVYGTQKTGDDLAAGRALLKSGTIDLSPLDAGVDESVELLQQPSEIDHGAVADHDAHVVAKNTRRHVVQRVAASLDGDRVARVGPALEACDHLEVLGQQVDDLALALVAPLATNDHQRVCAHQTSNRR